MDTLDSRFWSDTDGGYDEDLAIEAKRALAYLQTNRNYRYVEFLAQGGYGWVSLVYDDNNSRPLAIKCTADTSEMELSWWPKLNHPNILPLLEHLTLDTCTVFIMPAMRKDFWMLINEPRFYEEEMSFGLCRIWLRDLASALDYLHGQFLCHLDLKLDNVFLKPDGFACLGDFSLLSDIREVPRGFHFLEIYEPPEYTQWCHGIPPGTISSALKFGGDKADMWQYGILAVDLLTNLSLSSLGTGFTLWHHDVWPTVQKILLHDGYLNFLLEETFVHVLFQDDDLTFCHDFLTKILCLEPDERINAATAKTHTFVDIEWPHLPREFTLPELVIEHTYEEKPLPIEEIKDASMTPEEAVAAAIAEEKDDAVPDIETIGALDVMQRKMKKMQQEKKVRRESIAVEAGKKLVEIRSSIKGLPKELALMQQIKERSTSRGTRPKSSKKDRLASRGTTPPSSKEDRPASRETRPSSSKKDRPASRETRPSSSKKDRPASRETRPLSSKKDRPASRETRPSSSKKDRPASRETRPSSSKKDRPASRETTPSSSKKDRSPKQDQEEKSDKVKTTSVYKKTPLGKKVPIKVTSVKKSTKSAISPIQKKKKSKSPTSRDKKKQDSKSPSRDSK